MGPQSKEMKIQWIQIDGRNVPFVLPQVWNEELQDWVVTSDVNRLPTNDKTLAQKMDELKTAVGKVQDPAVKTVLDSILQQLTEELNVKVNNLPEIQKVKDDLVLAKLGELETQIKAINEKLDGTLNTRNTMDHYGATEADRPSVSEVPIGAYYKAVDTEEFWQSNGANWVVKV